MWHSSESSVTEATILYDDFEYFTFKLTATSSRGQWVKQRYNQSPLTGDTREEGPIEVPDGPTSDDITVIPDSQETNKELRTDTNNSSPEVSPKRGKTSFAAESHEADFEIEEDFDEDMLSEEERQEMRVKTAAAAERRL